MLKNILKILLIMIVCVCTSCSYNEETIETVEIIYKESSYYYLNNNPIDEYFYNEYIRQNDSVSAINDEAIAYVTHGKRKWNMRMM